MTNMDLVHQYLPEDLWKATEEYDIPDEFLQQYGDIAILLLNSKSVAEKEEKQSWFSLFPLMNEEQILKLRDILSREKAKLEEIEQRYAQKQDEIKKKYTDAFGFEKVQEQQRTIQKAEEQVREQEEMEAESLLQGL